MRISLIVFIVLICKLSLAQNESIVVNKDARLDVLTQKQTVINKRAKLITSTGLYRGYRLQVLNTNDRTKAFTTKTNLLTIYPNQKTYIVFQSPNFKVRFGNFLKRGDAEKMRKELTKQFPQGVFIVDDTIEYYPVNDEDVK